MPTLPEDAIRLAKQLTEEARTETALRAEAPARAPTDDAAATHRLAPAEPSSLQVPMFLHERELTDALRTVTLLASGRNSFQPEPLERLSTAQQTEVLRALAVIACTLASEVQAPSGSVPPEPVEPYDDGTAPAAKRPLQEYLDRIEKQAILEALEEPHHNRTAAARLMGITFRSLRYRMERLSLEF